MSKKQKSSALKKNNDASLSRMILTSFGFVLIGIVISFLFRGYNNSSNLKNVININQTYMQSHLWSTYSPHRYFEIRTATSKPLRFGLFWYISIDQNILMKHECVDSDNLKTYSYDYHDGDNYFTQILEDDLIKIKILGVIDQNNWSVQLNFSFLNPETQLVTYFYDEEQEFPDHFIDDIEIQGVGSEHGNFKLFYESKMLSEQLVSGSKDETGIFYAFISGLVKDNFNGKIRLNSSPFVQAIEKKIATAQKNIVFNHWLGSLEQENTLNIHFRVDYANVNLLSQTEHFHERLLTKFDKLFYEQSKFGKKEKLFGLKVLGNLLGGIGYFHGYSIVKTSDSIYEYGPHSLLTATPSRHQFPRGFLWDEGFHQLVICRWNVQQCMTMISHWLNIMNQDGWIPREQILGPFSRSKVPPEFLHQSEREANPPAMILAIEYIMDDYIASQKDENSKFIRDWLVDITPRVILWFEWFNSTQSGDMLGSYRWRNREVANREKVILNPLTLSSGLDDYPRSSHVTSFERHLDLRCWMTVMSRIIMKLLTLTSYSEDALKRFIVWNDLLTDEKLLNSLHWSDKDGIYADYGLHSTKNLMIRTVHEEPERRLVTDAFGYISMFPLALKVLSPDSDKLPIMLEKLYDNSTIWTQYGIASLSKDSPYYGKYNSETDPPYWRGAIWININYLIYNGLRYYQNHADTPSKIAEKCKMIANQLQENLVRNIMEVHHQTGYLWEQYNEITGKGQRAHPFCGWTSLVALLLKD